MEGVIENVSDFVQPFVGKNGKVNKKGHEKAKEIAKNFKYETLKKIVAFFEGVSVYVDMGVSQEKAKKSDQKKQPKEIQYPLFGDLD